MEEKRFKIKVTITETHERYFSVPAKNATDARRKVRESVYNDGNGYIYDKTLDEGPSQQNIRVVGKVEDAGWSWMEKGEIYAL